MAQTGEGGSKPIRWLSVLIGHRTILDGPQSLLSWALIGDAVRIWRDKHPNDDKTEITIIESEMD